MYLQPSRSKFEKRASGLALVFSLLLGFSWNAFGQAGAAPSTYSAYTGTDTKVIPTAPTLGVANTVIADPTFGSRILRVTDPNTNAGESFISTDSGFTRAWNANSTAIKLTGPHGDGYWLEFNPTTFQVGTGTASPVIHSVPFGATWEWSAVDPNIIYFLNGNQIATYNTSTGAITNLAGPSDGEPVGYMAVVIGLDNWICAAAGPGGQNTYSKIFCVNPLSPSVNEFIDVYNKTINGVAQSDPNWPTSAPGQVIGIHDISGGTGASWLETTFHQQSWGANGGAVLNLATNTWTLITNADPYWSGHVSMGNGKYANSAGSVDGRDSRGIILRDPNNAMNASEYLFVDQPPNTLNQWCDADHNSWLNSVNNPNAPILSSRYTIASSCQFAFTGEIDAAAVDGSNTVWRFAHNHNGGPICYYAESFAQISNDGNWALFSSYWDGGLGADTSFGCSTRIDTFIVELANPGAPSSGGATTSSGSSTGSSSSGSTAGSTTGTTTGASSGSTSTGTTASPASAPTVTRIEQNASSVAYTGTWYPNAGAFNSGGSSVLGMNAGSNATLSFTGTGVNWIGYGDPWSGIANVYVDGVLNGQVDTYSAQAKAQAVMYSVTGLSNANHTFAIEATGTADANSSGMWVWVDAFDVTSAAPITTTSGGTTSTTGSSSGTSTTSTANGTTPGSQIITTPVSFAIADGGGIAPTTQDLAATMQTGYGVVQSSSNSTAPSGLAIFGFRENNILVTEAGVPAAPLIQSGLIYAQVNGPVNTGIAIANPSGSTATISFFFTDANGNNFGQGSTVIPAGGQIAKFLTDVPFNSGSPLQGTFTFTSSQPVAAVALRGFTNERSEFLMTTLPVSPLTATAGQAVIFPHFADGLGWSSQVVLVNPTGTPMSGTLQFFGQGSAATPGQALSLTVNGQTSSTFSYSIPAGSSATFQTSGGSSTLQVGSVRAIPDSVSGTPAGNLVFSYVNNGITVTQAGIPAIQPSSEFQMYAETSGDFADQAVGSVQTGIALTNPSSTAVTVNLGLTSLAGVPTGLTGSIQIPAQGQTSLFLDQVPGFASLPATFQGVLQISTVDSSPLSTSTVSAIGLRGRYNERGDFLVTTTAAASSSGAASTASSVIPQLVDGGGYTTQFILFSGLPGLAPAGTLQLFTPSGGILNLPLLQ